MLAKAEVVIVAALIAYIVTFVTARIPDRWRRYRRLRIRVKPTTPLVAVGLRGRDDARIVRL
jgi:hypothetical protein